MFMPEVSLGSAGAGWLGVRALKNQTSAPTTMRRRMTMSTVFTPAFSWFSIELLERVTPLDYADKKHDDGYYKKHVDEISQRVYSYDSQ